MNYFITAIGTDSGKTFVSAIFCQALLADYWKPIQAGEPYDSETISRIVKNPNLRIHREAYALKIPASPHASALAEGTEIKREGIKIPRTDRDLIIEGAGGVYVPINDHDLMIDIASWNNLKVILVSNYYLGSINHTLLTFEALKNRKLNTIGIVFNGKKNEESKRIILHHTKLPCLLEVDWVEQVTPDIVELYANKLNENRKSRLVSF